MSKLDGVPKSSMTVEEFSDMLNDHFNYDVDRWVFKQALLLIAELNQENKELKQTLAEMYENDGRM